ncbi:hypothetical protein [Caldovatus aquaticus]|uniref:Uncharacterized protein n=1 Tax=Caldovatus aquaticus TaxID=2865671 RepID=A0ABS7F0L9_9PROT|nr:hypothetical protein [Caldovatus aquaticus]MBW8269177.1 hypothetical protein [Caldovatus aquaticus]
MRTRTAPRRTWSPAIARTSVAQPGTRLASVTMSAAMRASSRRTWVYCR